MLRTSLRKDASKAQSTADGAFLSSNAQDFIEEQTATSAKTTAEYS